MSMNNGTHVNNGTLLGAPAVSLEGASKDEIEKYLDLVALQLLVDLVQAGHGYAPAVPVVASIIVPRISLCVRVQIDHFPRPAP